MALVCDDAGSTSVLFSETEQQNILELICIRFFSEWEGQSAFFTKLGVVAFKNEKSEKARVGVCRVTLSDDTCFHGTLVSFNSRDHENAKAGFVARLGVESVWRRGPNLYFQL